jgi:hypothetical protein
MDCLLKKIPLLRYLKDPVERIEKLSERYPLGGQKGWFAFVVEAKTFAYWDAAEERWELLTGKIEQDMEALRKAVEELGSGTGTGGLGTKVEALEEETGKLWTEINLARYNAMHAVNHTRGCININTADRKVEITDDIYVYTRVWRAFIIEPGDISWITGEFPDDDTYYLVADVSGSEMEKPVYVIGGNADMDSWPPEEGLVVVGMFFVQGGEVQGLHFCNDDVKVNGEYIYDNPPDINITGDATFLGNTRGAMNIDTVNKRITLAGAASVIANSKKYTVPAGNYVWNKGNAVDYSSASTYTVYAVILYGSTPAVSLAVMSNSALFVPPAASAGVACRIGAFYWTGSEVGGINFGNDGFVDGNYLYDSGSGSGAGSGGGIEEAPADGFLYARSNGTWVKSVSLADFELLVREVHRALYNLFDMATIQNDSRIRYSYGTIESNSGTIVSGVIPVIPGTLYAIEGVDLTNGKVRLACLDDSENVIRATNPDGTYIPDSAYEVYASAFKTPSTAVSLYFQVKLYGNSSGYNGLDNVYMYKL